MKEKNSGVSSEVIADDKNKCKQNFLYPFRSFYRQRDGVQSILITSARMIISTALGLEPLIFVIDSQSVKVPTRHLVNLSISLGSRKSNIAIRSHLVSILDDTAKDPEYNSHKSRTA